MGSEGTPLGPGSVTVPLHVARAAQIDLQRALDSLDDVAWLGELIDPPAADSQYRRVHTDLELPIHDGSGTRPIRKSALIDLGPVQDVEGFLRVDIAWRSASLTPLFPVFTGQLQISATRLTLQGRYAPPFGKLGLVIDEALLHLVARRTAEAFLDRLAASCRAPQAPGP
jgi:hypothetical protein